MQQHKKYFSVVIRKDNTLLDFFRRYYFLLIFCVMLVFSFQIGSAQTKSDSLIVKTIKKDSLSLASDTNQVAAKDSTFRVRPIPLAGTISRFGDSVFSIHSSEIPWLEYRSLSDLLWQYPGVYIRDMASPGRNAQLNINGVDNRSIAVMVDGVSHNDPITGTYNLSLYPVEAIERIEIISGPRAFLYGYNSTGGAVNLITNSYYTGKPLSHLRYSQGLHGYTQTDVLFTQNLFSRFNFTFGLSYNGFGSANESEYYRGRFKNSNDEAWTFRTKLRYNLSDNFNIMFTHFYHQTWTGLNGGIDLTKTPTANIFNDIAAEVTNLDAYEKLFNHHFNLSAIAYPFGDSTLVATLSAYHNTQLREYRDEENRRQTNGIYIANDDKSSLLGGSANVEWKTARNVLSLRAVTEQRNYTLHGFLLTQGSFFVASAKDEFTPTENITVAGFFKADRYLDNLGGDVRTKIHPNVSVYAGYSQSHYFVNPIENIFPGSQTNDERHSVAEAGITFNIEQSFSTQLTYIRRVITNFRFIDTANSSLTLTILQNKIIEGINLSVHVQYGNYFFDGRASYLNTPTLSYSGKTLTLFPKLYADGSVYFRGFLAKGNLELKAGLRGKFITEQNGMAPYEVENYFIPYTLSSFGPGGAVDLFFIGHIGDADIHLIWENLLGSEYILTPIYPMYERNIRFGITWEFWN